ncbi:MAG: alanine--tRNA ligase [Deferribacteraceae bacterium]|jgi:alanyl-tRNA synthetase|nr:alanine--tRNA ligase [Deferribacteraceae bacterium]
MTGNDIRRAFLRYFEERAHTVVSSSSLVPQDDPTLLFANAGMNQFKDTFLGKAERSYSRAASCQKVVRAGGKHNDLENVGRTSRHHTFFEMLGNFSFGDYFKKEAIRFAWNFLTEELKLPADKLFVSIYKDDDEAFALWKRMGLSDDKIFRRDEKDNFWQMGETGPCGPCSEIHIDQGPGTGCGRPDCNPDCDCDRHLELWNLVFMQFNRDADGVLHRLPKPSIDTGMGLERVASVVQQVKSNYDTDLIFPIIDYVAKMCGENYGDDPAKDVSMRVIADHARSSAFLIADGVLPSNEGRGYVLRRIMRRAMRHGALIGAVAGGGSAFFYKVCSFVIDFMKEHYAELADKKEYVEKVVTAEESAFERTLNSGLKLIDEEIFSKLPAGSAVGGELIFKLYDTYGFPVDLQKDILEDAGYVLDMPGFEKQMSRQQEMARKSSLGLSASTLSDEVIKLSYRLKTEFVGYENLKSETVVRAVIGNEIILDSTPFYPEGGGQASDTGEIKAAGGSMVVEKVYRIENAIVHRGVVTGLIKEGERAVCEVDREKRLAASKNHTATHLLHKALRMVLGEHARQAGSYVSAESLRFDFTHFSGITAEELKKSVDIVNNAVFSALPVKTCRMSRTAAADLGAVALFGEKYGEEVRVVDVDGFSQELCGGTHVDNTNKIGLFVITSESGIASGVRRIEALTGRAAFSYLSERLEITNALSQHLKTPAEKLFTKIGDVLEREKALEKKLRDNQRAIYTNAVHGELGDARLINGARVLSVKLPNAALDDLRAACEYITAKKADMIVLLSSVADGKLLFVCGVSKPLVNRFKAGDIIKEVARAAGGSGGGRPEMAQGGGQAEKLNDAVDKFYAILQTR